MFKYDFIILYEHRNRELENAVLLAMMLEKEGYKVAIEYRWSARILFQRADVVITPYLYQNETVVDFALHPFCHIKKIINMQYEQVFCKKDEDVLSDLPKGVAKNAVHISWGKNTTERYKKVKIKADHIFEIGHVSIDLNKPMYRDAFISRENISTKFNLPNDKNWLLFISSFSYVGISKTEFEICKARSCSASYFSEISCKSQPLVLDYFEKIMKDYPELIVIYRPHPHEDSCNRLFEIEKKYDNFKVIRDFSVRQWILISDYISTWYSTSFIDVMYAKKPCAIIRPISISEDYDYKFFRKQPCISSYQDLSEFIRNPEARHPINPEPIQEYYCNNEKNNAFKKLCDVCIKVKKEKKYEYDYSGTLRTSFLYLFMLYVYKILLSLAKYVDYSRFTPEKYRTVVHYSHREMNKFKDDVELYRKNFSGIVRNEDT